MPEVRGEEERDSAFGVQCGEWGEQRRFDQVIGRFLGRRRQLLRWRVRLQLIYFGAGVRASHFAFDSASPRLAEAARPASIICWIIPELALLWTAS